MKELSMSELTDNMVEAIGKEWMLVTAGTPEKFNTMTASWGGTGVLWGKPVAFVFIRPERYTYEFTEAGDGLTLSFLGAAHKKVHQVCGSTSGRTTDKVAAAGLHPVFTPDGNVCFEEARLVLECKKLYADNLRPEGFTDPSLIDRWYNGHGGFHRMYVAAIEHIWTNDSPN
ncbi:MAG: flavin reductase [Phocaeicola plebeius]|nr:flavin reductase [Phocaeicola plebeius]